MGYLQKYFKKDLESWKHSRNHKSLRQTPLPRRAREMACCSQAQASSMPAPCPWWSMAPSLVATMCRDTQFTAVHILATRYEALRSPFVQLVPYECVYLGNNHLYSLLIEHFTQCSQQGPFQIELQTLIKFIYTSRPTTFEEYTNFIK